MASTFRDLVVWQRAMQMVTSIYKVTEHFPKSELYGLTSQLRRAAVSVPSNIAEGQGRKTDGEFKQFLSNARGSLMEVETQIEIAFNLGYIAAETRSSTVKDLERVAQLCNGLYNSLSDRKAKAASASSPAVKG